MAEVMSATQEAAMALVDTHFGRFPHALQAVGCVQRKGNQGAGGTCAVVQES